MTAHDDSRAKARAATATRRPAPVAERVRAALRRPLPFDPPGEAPSGVLGRLLVGLLIALPMVVTAIYLLPELTLAVPNLNDDAFHITFVRRMSEALATGRNPIDFWIPDTELGFAGPYYYQNFPHLAVVLLDRMTLGTLGLFTVFNLVRLVLLVGFPVVVFWSLRRMGFPTIAAAVAAAASPLISADLLYGFEYSSYIWRGWGMYTQLWAMNLSFVTLALCHRTIEKGTGYLWAILALSVLVLSHLLYAYMMAITLVLVVLVGARRHTFLPRLTRLAIIGVAMAAITAYQWLPWITTSQYLSANLDLQSWKHDSFGAQTILGWLFSGALLDAGRLPVLTALLAVGVASVFLYRTRLAALSLVGFLFWLVFYFGRPTLGPLLDALPLPSGFLLHRLIGSVEIFALMLIGLGGLLAWHLLARIAAAAAARGADIGGWRPVVGIGLLILLFLPAMQERATYYKDNTTFMTTTSTALAGATDLDAIIRTIKASPGGRVYAGMRTGWGAQMKVGDLFVKNVLVADLIPVVGPPDNGFSLNGSHLWYFDERNASQYDLLDVRYVIAPVTLPVPDFYQPVQRSGRYALYSVPTSGVAGYVSVQGRAAVRDAASLFAANQGWWMSDAFKDRGVQRWDYPGSSAGEGLSGGGCPSGGRTVSEQVGAGSIDVVVECPTASPLMLKVSYHPDWRVTVDGLPVDTYMVSPSYLAIDLPAGRHEVKATYEVAPVKWPLLLLGLVALVVVAVLRDRLDLLPRRLAALRLPRGRDAAAPAGPSPTSPG